MLNYGFKTTPKTGKNQRGILQKNPKPLELENRPKNVTWGSGGCPNHPESPRGFGAGKGENPKNPGLSFPFWVPPVEAAVERSQFLR